MLKNIGRVTSIILFITYKNNNNSNNNESKSSRNHDHKNRMWFLIGMTLPADWSVAGDLSPAMLVQLSACRQRGSLDKSSLGKQLPDPVLYKVHGEFLAEPMGSDTPH